MPSSVVVVVAAVLLLLGASSAFGQVSAQKQANAQPAAGAVAAAGAEGVKAFIEELPGAFTCVLLASEAFLLFACGCSLSVCLFVALDVHQ